MALLQSPQKTKDTMEIWNAVLEVAPHLNLTSLLPKILEYLYSALYEIKDDLSGLYAMAMLGVNPFDLK